jgi:cyanophycin synthetase
VRLVEIRLLEGPNLYRLEPAVKVEVAVGAEDAWHGARDDAEGVATRLWTDVPPAEQPPAVAHLAAWCGRLRVEAGRDPVADVHVHRASDPGHWVVTFPWRGAERARTLAEAAWRLAVEEDLDPATVHSDHPDVVAAVWRISGATAHGPAMLTDAVRRVPVISISGTNGKSTVTRMVAHVLRRAGRRVGFTTSDGIHVDGRLVEPGDWTGPGGAAAILGRADVDVAVLETARGGILLRGVGYASNEASVLTNVSADHLDLQGIHTLPELAAAKATICRITRPDGWVVLNADDRHVAAVADLVAAQVAFFSLVPDASPVLGPHLAAGGRAYVLRDGALVETEAGAARPFLDVADLPAALGGLARHNVANALAAAGGARALGATLEEVAEGLRDFRLTADRSPGRLNLFRHGKRVVIVDFAHNEAGLEALLDVAEGIAAGGSAGAWPVIAIIGTAGDRPDDAIRGIGRIAGARATRVAIKETLDYLRGRDRAAMVDLLRAGVAEGLAASGRVGGATAAAVPVHETEVTALRAELIRAAGADGRGRPDQPAVVALMCHAERDGVFRLLADLGARPLDAPGDLRALVPRLTQRPPRG